MANYSAIKAAVNAYIKANGRKEITGMILNSVLNATIDSLGRFFQFAGGAIPADDPGTPDQNVCYLATEPGVYTNFGGITIDIEEVALLFWNGTWTKQRILIGIREVTASVDNNVGTPSVDVSYSAGVLVLTFHNLKGEQGETGDPAGFGTIGADITGGVGTPGVSVETSGGNDAKNIMFHFTNLKGETGVTSVVATIDNTSGTPSCQVSLAGGVLTLAFSGLKGLKGDTGVSADYPITIYNGLDSDATDQALSAAQGKVLDGKISQLNGVVNGVDETTEVLTPKSLTADKTYNTNVSTMATSPSDNEGYYCTRIAVTPGEVYRLSGVRSTSKYTLLFATANSSRARLRRDEQGDGSRVTIDVTIETGEAWLYVNLGSYNSATDGVWKVTEETIHTDGLADDVQDLDTRVTALENAPTSNVIDSLDSTSATDSLSANQGRVLNEDINGVTTISYVEQEILVGKYCNTSLSRITSKQYLPSAEGVACVYAYVQPGDVFRIYGKGNAFGYQLYAMADADRYIVENGKPGVAMDTRENPLELTIPAGVARLCVNLQDYDPLTDKVEKRITTTTESVKTRLTALERETAGITALALPLSGKKVMILGDSIFEFTDEDEKGVTDYFGEYSLADTLKGAIGGTRLVQRATPVDTPTTTTQAYAALDICNIVKAWSEADYTKQDAAVEFLDRYAEQIATLKANPISGVDYVIIGGGTNDITNESPIGTETDSGFTTLWGAFNEMVNLLLTANPKLKIFFASPIVGYRASARTDANWDDNYVYPSGKTKPQYIELFSQMVGKSHIPYIDLYFTAGVNQVNFSEYFIDSDNRHPYKGFYLYARRLYQRVLANLM